MIIAIMGYLNVIPGVLESASWIYPIFHCLLSLIPIAYACKWNLGLIFKMPKRSDIKVIILCYFAYLIFSIVITAVLTFFGFNMVSNADTEQMVFGLHNLLVFVQLLGEELFKFAVLILAMSLLYHFTGNRKNALVFGSIVCMVIFGLIHLTAYNNNVIQCLLVIGLGCIIHLYPYLKTKNLLNSYILHLMIDLIPVVFTLLPH